MVCFSQGANVNKMGFKPFSQGANGPRWYQPPPHLAVMGPASEVCGRSTVRWMPLDASSMLEKHCTLDASAA